MKIVCVRRCDEAVFRRPLREMILLNQNRTLIRRHDCLCVYGHDGGGTVWFYLPRFCTDKLFEIFGKLADKAYATGFGKVWRVASASLSQYPNLALNASNPFEMFPNRFAVFRQFGTRAEYATAEIV